jgi:N-acetylmuramoyl-L-alanine amidase
MNRTEDKKPRRRYRLNGKKLVSTLFMLAAVVAVVVAVTMALKDASAEKASALGASASLAEFSSLPDAALDQASLATDVKATPAPGAGCLAGSTIVVDAGHGGFDPGAIGVSGVREDEINLAVAKDLKTKLEDIGAIVIMTRADENAIGADKDSDMAKRRRIIEESASDIVISIHMNNFKDDPKVSGPLVLFMPGSVKGEALAEVVQKSLNAELDTDGQPRSDNLYILKSGNQPCVLVECGYLSNEKEEEQLRQPEYQKRIALAICAGTVEFLRSK